MKGKKAAWKLEGKLPGTIDLQGRTGWKSNRGTSDSVAGSPGEKYYRGSDRVLSVLHGHTDRMSAGSILGYGTYGRSRRYRGRGDGDFPR